MSVAAARRRLGIGVIGFGWLGQAHSRSLLRIPALFEDRAFDPVLVACSDVAPDRAALASGSFAFARAGRDWRAVIDDPEVDVVVIAAPNSVHAELVRAAAQAGKAVFCEKPVGGRPADVARAAAAVRDAGVTGGVGFNYRWAPLVRHAAELLRAGDLGTVSNYRGHFFSMYGSDPRGAHSWRFDLAQGGHGASSDLLSHSVDLAHFLVGPITRVVATTATFVCERPLPAAGDSHYGRGRDGGPMAAVTNEDYVALLCEFAGGARGTFEASRTMVGPESEMAFDAYGTGGAVGWSFEALNELRVHRATDGLDSGYTTVRGGERFGHHGRFAPGNANGIGFEDLIVIEDYEFLAAVADGRPFAPGFDDALAWARVQAALLRSAADGRWASVEPLDEEARA